MLAPMNIRDAESTPVKRMPILSRMMPARIRNPMTLKMISELPYMPKTSGVQPRWASIMLCSGDIMSTNM